MLPLPGLEELYLLADLFADLSHLTQACLGLLATASSRRLCHQDVVAATKWWWGGGKHSLSRYSLCFKQQPELP